MVGRLLDFSQKFIVKAAALSLSSSAMGSRPELGWRQPLIDKKNAIKGLKFIKMWVGFFHD